ncbi:PAS domain S-box protein [Bacillus sp. SCS-153A]|uniref:PAS domain S-box protein n=1 Tax=Rossellomorea sedimentorum TaxID=3115294 RepID=UPI003905C668
MIKKQTYELEQEPRPSDSIGFREVLAASPNPILIVDKDLTIIEANSSAMELLETEENMLLSESFAQFFQAVPSPILSQYEDAVMYGGVIEDETLMTTAAGNIKHIELKITKLNKSDYAFFFLRDITSEREKQRNEHMNLHMLNNIFQQAAEGILLFDREGNIKEANQAFCRQVNLQKKDVLDRKVISFVPKNFHLKLIKIKELLDSGRQARGEMPITHPEGVSVVEFTTTPYVNHELHMAILRDITEKRQMEIQLKRSEELFKDLFEEAIDAIVLWDQDGRVLRANRSALKIFECSLSEILTKKIEDFVYPLEMAKFESVTHELKAKGAVRDEVLFLMPNNQLKHLEFTSKLHSVDGYNMTIFRNVSERHQMEKSLRESEERFRKIFEGTLDGMVLTNHSGQVVDANPVALKILSSDKDKLIGSDIKDIFMIKENEDEEYLQYQAKLKEEGQASLLKLKKIDEERSQHLELSSKYNLLSNLNLTVIRDITEEVELQDQLRKSDTLSVVGELAAGIAHEIRNPMTALKGFIQLLENNMESEHEMYFHVIKSELQRIESIITEFLILAKPQAVQYQETNLVRIMKDTLELLNAQAVMHNVQFMERYKRGVPAVFAEPNQLKQVFINIVKNAIEVMPKGGLISINISEKNADKVRISITDEGMGIPKEKIKKLGEPFYTTKERGTGLGLMVTFKIVEEHDGTVEVESELGKGTTFHIDLPSMKG